MKWLRDAGVIDAPAATNRPSGTAWGTTGFVVVSIVGASGPADVPYNVPALSFDTWAVPTSGTGQPPYGHASGLAQIIRDAAVMGMRPNGPLPTLPGFDPVRLTGTMYPLSELRRVAEPDGSSFAHYSVDIALGWVRVPT
jgi:hypothetical protein